MTGAEGVCRMTVLCAIDCGSTYVHTVYKHLVYRPHSAPCSQPSAGGTASAQSASAPALSVAGPLPTSLSNAGMLDRERERNSQRQRDRDRDRATERHLNHFDQHLHLADRIFSGAACLPRVLTAWTACGSCWGLHSSTWTRYSPASMSRCSCHSYASSAAG